MDNILISLLPFSQGASERRSVGSKGTPVLPGEADRAEQRGRDHQRGKRVTSVTRYPRRADLEPVQFLQRLTSRWKLTGEPVPNYHLWKQTAARVTRLLFSRRLADSEPSSGLL